jgi:hypothetical protein
MRISFAAAALAALAALGCSKARKSEVIPRDRDAGPAVVVVDRKPSTGVKIEKEKEPNNSAEKATALAVPGSVRGTLDSSADVDVYKLQVEQAIAVKVSLSALDKVDLKLDLRDAEGKILVKSDRGPAGTEEGISNYKLEAGSYYLAVSEFVKRSRRKKRRRRRKKRGKKRGKAEPEKPARVGESQPYELAIAPVGKAGESFEREPNNKLEQSRELTVAEYQGFGYVGWSGDVDVWKLALLGVGSGKGMNLDLTGVSGVTFTLELLDGAGKRLLRRKGGKGRSVAVRNVVPRDGEQFYYARLRTRRSNPAESYELRLTTRLLDPDEEREPNDSSRRASNMQAEEGEMRGTWKGYLAGGDVDYWKIPKQKGPMMFSVTVTPPHDTDIKLEAKVGGKLIGEGNSGKRGGAEQFAQIPIPAGKELVLRISGWGAERPSAHYKLQWMLSPGQPAPAPAPKPSVDDDYGE